MKKRNYEEEIKKISDFLIEKRTNAKLSVQDLAEKLEINEKEVVKWEEGIKVPDNITMLALSSILKFDVEQLPKVSKKQRELNNMTFELYDKYFRIGTLLQWVIICLISFDLLYSDTLKNYFNSLDTSNFWLDGSIFLVIAVALVLVVLLIFIYTAYKIFKCERVITNTKKKD